MNRLFTASVAKSASSSFAFSATSLTRSCAFTSSASLVSSQSPVQTASITCESRCRFFHASLSSHAAAGGEAELDNDDAVFSSKLVKKGKSGAKGAFAKSITFDITRAASMSLDDLYDTFHRRGKFMNALHINRFLYRYMRLAEKSDEQRDGGASVMTGTTKAAMMRDRRLGWIIQRTVELVRFMDARTLANTTQIIAKLGPSMQAQSQLLLKVICRYALIHIDDFRPAEVANLAQSLSSIAIITKEDSLSKLDDRIMTLSASEVEAVMVGLTKRMLILVDDQSMGMAIETEMYGDVTERDPVQVQDVLKMRESLERTGLTQSSLDLNKITLSALSYADGVDAFDVGSASTGVVKLLSLPLSAFDANNAEFGSVSVAAGTAMSSIEPLVQALEAHEDSKIERRQHVHASSSARRQQKASRIAQEREAALAAKAQASGEGGEGKKSKKKKNKKKKQAAEAE